MKLFLRILTAIALIMVIIAATVYVVRPPSITDQANQEGAGAQGNAGPASVKSYQKDPRSRQRFTNIIDVSDNPIQPSYRPINQPAFLQLIRQEGKTYQSVVLGKLTGRASKADWGLVGTVHFNYLYGLESSGYIKENDGVTVIEERSFTKAQEDLIVSSYELGINLGRRVNTLLDLLSEVPKIGGIATAINSMDGKSVNIPKGWVDVAKRAGLFEDIPQIDPAQFERELRMFTQGTNDRLLEGKKVIITFIDGQGIKTVEPVDCMISEKERDVIIRSNYALDHYVFPDRKVQPGDDWTVDGGVLSGLLDPRMSGKASGSVTIIRSPDHVGSDGEASRRLKIIKGNIVVHDTDNGDYAISGQMKAIKGVLAMPEKLGIVTSASLSGFADYQKVSTDHLLFQARHAVNPRFEIRYSCEVK